MSMSYNAAVVLHVKENLSFEQVRQLESGMSQRNGVRSVNVSERARHLVVVKYDPASINSLALLGNFRQQGYHAQLIGGI